MEDLGYQVLKGRGISFIDDKKVKIKGSEVGFSLMKIEKILALKQDLVARQINVSADTRPVQEIVKKGVTEMKFIVGTKPVPVVKKFQLLLFPE
jgi:sulfur transfer complex TusBCD TusB component (DsrH family)